MKYAMAGATLLSALVMGNPAQADTLVTNATISSITSAWFYSPFIQVTISGASGPCSNTTISFIEAFQGNTAEDERAQMNRHLSILLGARLSGRKVDILGASCANASSVVLR